MGAQVEECATHCPEITENPVRTRPMAVASMTLPGRRNRRYTPMKSATGTVMARVYVPQGDSARAFTTTRATTERRMIMMMRTAIRAMNPPRVPTSSFAIWPRVFPPRRMEQKRMTKS